MLRRWAFTFLRTIPLLLMLGALALGGAIAAHHAYQHQLGLLVVLFVAGTLIIAVAGWFYPRSGFWFGLAIGMMPAGTSLAWSFEAGLLWEAMVAFCVMCAAVCIPALASVMWWPLRGLSYEERRDIFRRLNEMPYDNRMRLLWSRRMDRFLLRD